MKTEIIPVIHMVTEQQVLDNVKTCVDCGIKKVFLINHVVGVNELLTCAQYGVRVKYPDLWIGVNMLGVPTEKALSYQLHDIDGLWCDGSISPEDAKRVREFKGMFFGGLAFKYQPQPADLESACKDSIFSTDVACTSGSGTGKAPTTVKINTIREFLGNHPMAIASGVSVDNIDSFKGVANYVLVASSITDRNEYIIKDKLVELINKIK